MQHFLYIDTWPTENPTIWEFFKDAEAPLTKVVLKALSEWLFISLTRQSQGMDQPRKEEHDFRQS